MKTFPRIYSISTVGLIFHYNQDYLLHPLRTDFNGESGIGKSMIADLLQLIFVAKKGQRYYKPGTDSSGSEGRGTETLPLDSIGYSFINIQKEDRKFLTIGIYIQRNTGNITPFIIQKGIHWDKNSIFEYLDKILLHTSFLTPDGSIAEIDFLKKNLLKPKGFVLETFPNSVSHYHNLLFTNKILPMDLSQEDDKLLTFAQIIQSFARAKSLKFDKKEFKNFLFSDDEEVYEDYKSQIDSLESSQRQYIQNRKTITKVEEKFEILKRYKDALAKQRQLKDSYYISKTSYDYQQNQLVKSDYTKIKEEWLSVSLSIEYCYAKIFKFKENSLLVDQRATDKDIEKTKDDIVKSDKEQVEGTIKLKDISLKLEEARTSLVAAENIQTGIKTIINLIDRFKTIEDATVAVINHPRQVADKRKLEAFIQHLEQKDAISVFQQSFFFDHPFKESFEKAIKKSHQLTTRILETKQLIDAYDSRRNDSLITWLLSAPSKKLTRIQESVFRHFIQAPTREPDNPINTTRYIPKPEFFLESIHVEKELPDAIWLNLNGIVEYIPLTDNPIFQNVEDISKHLNQHVENLKSELKAFEKEKEELDTLYQILLDSQFNQELLTLFTNKEAILSYTENNSLPSPEDFELFKKFYEEREVQNERHRKINQSWKDLSLDESNTRSELSKYEAKKLIDTNKLTELIQKASSLEKKLNTTNTEAKLRDEKIDTLKNQYHDLINSELLEKISSKVSAEFEKYIDESGSLNDKIYSDHIVTQSTRIENLHNKIVSYENIDNPNGLKSREDRMTQSMGDFYREFGFDFKPEGYPEEIKDGYVAEMYSKFENAKRNADNILENFIIPLAPDNDRVLYNKDLDTVARELLPKVFEGKESTNFSDDFEDQVMIYLKSINESVRDIDEHKLKLIQNIFNKVFSMYYDYEEKIKDIKVFFEEKLITGEMKVKVDFIPSLHYPIEWISTLKKQIANKTINLSPLFMSNVDENTSAEEIIIQTFLQHSKSNVKDASIKKLTNAKSYFDIHVSLVRPSGEKSDGSSGQDYAKIALLCIARLSRIERDKRQKKGTILPGLRFMPIDEVAGLGGNFEMLYQIAQEYDYQIITMTINPEVKLDQGKQYVYILNTNKDATELKINLPPFGLFNQDGLQKNIAAYIEATTHE